MLKYYVYVSMPKVNMLYPQIPPAFLSAAEAELKVNLGVASAGIKSRAPAAPTELVGRAAAVAAYIRQHEAVGSVAAPLTWFEGVARLRWGVVQEYASDIALFGGKVDQHTLALLGSSESIIGAAQTAAAQHAPFYYTLRFLNGVVNGSAPPSDQSPPYSKSWSDAVAIGLRALPETEHEMEFLARLVHTEGQLVVGTPLYVALR